MSAGKLDQSLDEIMKDSKTTRARPGRRNARRTAKTKATAAIAPSGGVKKNTRKETKTTTAAQAVAVPKGGISKIIVSGLPDDVGEQQIKDYFSKTIGAVRKVLVNYGPNGRSRGIAEVTFANHDSAAKAATELNGVKVDNRSMRIEVVMGAKQIAPPAPPKTLSDRIASKPKSAAKGATKEAPKSAAATAKKASANANGTSKDRPAKKSGRAGRAKPKTAAELDQEMSDYFVSTNGATTNGAAQPAATANAGVASMEDEVM